MFPTAETYFVSLLKYRNGEITIAFCYNLRCYAMSIKDVHVISYLDLSPVFQQICKKKMSFFYRKKISVLNNSHKSSQARKTTVADDSHSVRAEVQPQLSALTVSEISLCQYQWFG